MPRQHRQTLDRGATKKFGGVWMQGLGRGGKVGKPGAALTWIEAELARGAKVSK
jgi:hypothetical protein